MLPKVEELAIAQVPLPFQLRSGDFLSRACERIRSCAEDLERVLAAEALGASARDEMRRILALVDGMRHLVDGAAKDEHRKTISRPTSLHENPATGARQLSKQPIKNGDRTQFYRDQSHLVKLGLVGTSAAYRHLAPFEIVEQVATEIEQSCAEKYGEFTFDMIESKLPGLKSYQIRITIAWLRHSGLIGRRTRGRYFAEEGLATRVADSLRRLDEEPTSLLPLGGTKRKRSTRRNRSRKTGTKSMAKANTKNKVRPAKQRVGTPPVKKKESQ
jgi:hypothetical protein